jgi:hypothetical protein
MIAYFIGFAKVFGKVLVSFLPITTYVACKLAEESIISGHQPVAFSLV